MIEILRDPIWQLIGALVSIATLLVAFLRQSRRKSLSINLISTIPLYILRPEAKDKLKVFFDGKEVIGAHMIIVRVTNSGDLPILPSDYEKPITVNFSKKVEVLSAEVSEAVPSELTVTPEVHESTVHLPTVLLNGGDSLTLKILLNGFDNYLNFAARIVGIKNIELGLKGQKGLFIGAWTGMVMLFLGQALMFVSKEESLLILASVLCLAGSVLFSTAVLRNREFFRLLRTIRTNQAAAS